MDCSPRFTVTVTDCTPDLSDMSSSMFWASPTLPLSSGEMVTEGPLMSRRRKYAPAPARARITSMATTDSPEDERRDDERYMDCLLNKADSFPGARPKVWPGHQLTRQKVFSA